MHDLDLMVQLQIEGKHEQARAISDNLEALGPNRILDPTGVNTQDIWLRHSFNRGWFLLQEGKFLEGSQALENGRLLSVYGSPQLKTNAPLYNPSKHDIKGKSIILSSEGGIGDEIMHARFATSLKQMGAAKVYIACLEELLSVFKRIEGVDDTVLFTDINKVSHDYWLPGFSAGWVCGYNFDTLPNKKYMSSNPAHVEKYKNIIKSEKIKVGIRWAGNPKFEHQQFRKFPTEFVLNLSKYNELQLYSLQRDDNTVELPENIVDLQHSLETWEDTLAAIDNLDLVITSCTSIAHASAALGKETWVIVPALPYHTWAYKAPDSETSPWYESVSLFRQPKKDVWNPTFQKLYSKLEQKFSLSHIDMPDEDKKFVKLNLGCGLTKLPNMINIDVNTTVEPDQDVDLNVFPWPFESDSVEHITASNILHLLGDKPHDILKIISEMYRISKDGAIWEIETPHPRHDMTIGNPESKRVITGYTFNQFDKQLSADQIVSGKGDLTPATELNIDLEIVTARHAFSPELQNLILKKLITKDAAEEMMLHSWNIASSSYFEIRAHKPGRVSKKELETILEKRKNAATKEKVFTTFPNTFSNTAAPVWKPLFSATDVNIDNAGLQVWDRR